MRISAYRSLLAAGALTCLLGIASHPLQAAPVSGTVNIDGSVGVSANIIDFQAPVGPPNGNFMVSVGGNSGTFAGLGGTTGLMKDLNLAVQTVGTPFLLTNFITFTSAPNIIFNLTGITPGIFSSAACGSAPAAGQNCSVPGSPFNLTNLSATSSTVSLGVNGFVVDTSDNSSSNFTGLYTAQFPASSYQSLLTTISGGGTVNTSYSASFVATITPTPEPASFVLFGSSLIAVALLKRRARRS